MDVSGGLSVVQTVLELLGSPIWKEIESAFGVKSQLEKLKVTMSTIQNILLDAEEHLICSTRVDRGRLERLKEALYQADDLFDEVTTLLALRKQLMQGTRFRFRFRFLSPLIQLHSAFTWSREIKNIREMLGGIVNDHQHDFGLMRHPPVDLHVRHNPRETHSYVCEDDVIIGRDMDKQIVVDMLRNTTSVEVEENVSIISIVGIGGLGKTTLAQLVYNDDIIGREFPLKMWVCVSDEFDVKALVGKILVAATKETGTDGLNMDQLQMKLRQQLDGKKYLLVLDDIWNEDPIKWNELRKLLTVGVKGSRIVVTTRSSRVARIVGSNRIHELKGLSEEESWNLFERMSLETGQHHMQAHLVDVGKEIVNKCANVPLFIKVAGSLLRGQDESKWVYLKNTDLASVKQDEMNGIVPVLKVSYNYLPFHLKSCFSYCAVFPKDYKIIKEDLICLWMAQGFIMPLGQESLEDAGEDYFKQLLQRCFFQDVELAEGGDEIVSFTMHDLIHDLAKEVAGTEILSCNYSRQCFDTKTRHVYMDMSTSENHLGYLTNMKRMRTFLDVYSPLSIRKLELLLSKVRYLRVLRLCGYWTTLPSVIGNLVHLRYLDLSCNDGLCVLPSFITKLYNLQTLKLYFCRALNKLPRELRKLVNLRHLDISCCPSLTHMPPGMNNLTSLQKLTGFVVSGTSNGSVGELKDLENFINHSGTMEIYVNNGVRYNASEARKGCFLLNSKKLREIEYYYKYCSADETEEIINTEALLQGLQPHSNLRKLKLWYYPGMRFPSWGSSSINLQNCLPNLVKIEIVGCRRLGHLPLLSQLRYLKVLLLQSLHEVEYMESSSSNNNNGGDDDEELVFFPSLENLKLRCIPKLKGWWKSSSESGEVETPRVARLSRLEIGECPNLTTFPFCPELQELELFKFNEALGPIMMESTHASSTDSNRQNLQKNKAQQQEEEVRPGRLRDVMTDEVGYLNSLPIHSFNHLFHLQINSANIERLRIGEVGEVFQSGRLSSLRSLVIYDCRNLKSISGQGVWEHFTALETLSLDSLDELELELELEDEDDFGTTTTTEGSSNEGSEEEMPWRYLAPTLRSLQLRFLRKVVKLPKGIGCLSSLHSLYIERCDNLETLTPSIGGLSSLQELTIKGCFDLKTMPKEMCNLTSLTKLDIRGCSPELQNECERKNGANRSNIKHIPHVELNR